jgi:hypothetical protein
MGVPPMPATSRIVTSRAPLPPLNVQGASDRPGEMASRRRRGAATPTRRRRARGPVARGTAEIGEERLAARAARVVVAGSSPRSIGVPAGRGVFAKLRTTPTSRAISSVERRSENHGMLVPGCRRRSRGEVASVGARLPSRCRA